MDLCTLCIDQKMLLLQVAGCTGERANGSPGLMSRKQVNEPATQGSPDSHLPLMENPI
jgi:hypothetical protein